MASQPENVASEDSLVSTTFSYIESSRQAKQKRMERNRDNWDCYHLRQDYSHKKKGQSREFLGKQQTATDQLVSFLTQGLIDLGLWFRVDDEKGAEEKPLLTNQEIEKLLKRQLQKNQFYYLIQDALKVGALNSLMIIKVFDTIGTRPEFVVKENEETGDRTLRRIEKPEWKLQLGLVRPQDYHVDPTGDGLFRIQRIEMDKHKLIQIAEKDPDNWDMQAVKDIRPMSDERQRAEKSRETDQNQPFELDRQRIEMWEGWGTVLEKGTAKVLHDNSTWVVSDKQTLKKPMKNPLWDGQHPYIEGPLVRVPFSVWHRALMDAPTNHNRALNEAYNLMFDSGMLAAHGVRQIRMDWLEDPKQVSGGIPPGTTLRVNNQAPPGAKVMEEVQTSQLGKESIEMFNLTDREFQQSAQTNDVRLGSLPERNVKATEIVASNQTLTGIFQGMVKGVEERFLSPLLEKSWSRIAQNLHRIPAEELIALFGKERANEIRNMPVEDVYARTVQGKKYKVFGMSSAINKIQDFRKLTGLMQTIGGVPELNQEFRKKYSWAKMMGEIIKALDIDEEKILATDQEKGQAEEDRKFAKKIETAKATGGGGGEGGSPDTLSQIPKTDGASAETGLTEPRRANNVGITNP